MKRIINGIFVLVVVLLSALCVVACGDTEPELVSISAVMDADYTVYLFDDLDTSKITVTAKYSNDKEETVATADLQFSEIDTSKAGSGPLTISYKGKSTTLTIDVSDIKKQSVEGTKPTFVSNGIRDHFKIKVQKTGEWKYFADEGLMNELTEDELEIPKYVAKSATITKEPTATEAGCITITTTTDEALKVYIPELNDTSDYWGYTKTSKAGWVYDGFYAYRLNVDELKNDWWGNYNYTLQDDEYKIGTNDQVDVVRPLLESLEILTEEKAPAMSTRFIIDKVGSTMLEGESTSRVVVSGMLTNGELNASMATNGLSIYFKEIDTPYVERFTFKSIEVLNADTKEYKIVTNYYTASNDVPLGMDAIQCSSDSRGALTDMTVKPHDELISAHKKAFNLTLNTLNDGEVISVGDVLCIDGFPCEVVNIRDITNNVELEKVLSGNEALISIKVEILNSLGITMYMTDYQRIRTGHAVNISKYEEGGIDFIDRQIGTGKVTTIISKVKVDITVKDTDQIAVGDTIENLIPGALTVTEYTDLANARTIGKGKILSVPHTRDGYNMYIDVIMEIETTSSDMSLPESSNNYYSSQCLDYLNSCLSIGETMKVYNADKSILLTIAISDYNFD